MSWVTVIYGNIQKHRWTDRQIIKGWFGNKYKDTDKNKKSPANAMGNVQLRCMFESPAKQDLRQSPEGARQPAAKLSIVFYSYSPEAATCLAQPTPYQLKIASFQYPLWFIAFIWGDLLRIYGKALRFLKLQSSRQPTVKIWWS